MKLAKTHSPVKVLLLNPPYKELILRDNYSSVTSKSGYLWPPVDLLYISALLNTPDFKVDVLEAIAEKLSWKEVETKILGSLYDAIIVLTGTSSFRTDLPPLQKLKQKLRFRLYAVGNLPVFMPREFMELYPFVDGIFHSYLDPEIPLLLLGKRIVGNSITYRLRGNFHLGKINAVRPVNLGHAPLYAKFPLKKYGTMFSKKTPLATSLLTYGCPFRCSFCIQSEIGYVPRDIDDIRMEFAAMEKAGVKEIFFQDSTFNTNPKRFGEVLELLGKYNFSWSANIHSFHLTPETMRIMRRAGCHTIQIGVESGDQQILDAYAPSKRKPIIAQIMRDARSAGIRTLGYFIIGFPKDTPETVKRTIDFAIEINPDFASFSMMTPDYGTELFREVTTEGQYKHNGLKSFDSSAGAVIVNPTMPKKIQDKLLFTAYRRFYLRPRKLIEYLTRPSYIGLYATHAVRLFAKQIRHVLRKG